MTSGRSDPPTIRESQRRTVAREADETAPLGPQRPAAALVDQAPASGRMRLPAPGDRVADRYVIDRLLGSGGMAHVFAAADVVENRRVALKVLDVELAASDAARERFAREASAMAALTSRHTVRVYGVGEITAGLPYMAMELLLGEDLGALLVRRGALPFAEACDYLAQACEAVAEAHAAGIVHRDLKPRNLHLADGIVRVLDFGIARAASGVLGKLQSLTHAGDFLGTMAYASPEQIKSPKQADARADIWSLGACLYRLVTGTLPFAGENEIDIMKAVFEREPPPISATRPDAPPAVEEVVRRCLKKDPAERYASAEALGEALRAARKAAASGGGGVKGTVVLDAPPVALPPLPPSRPVMSSVAPSQPTAPSQRKQRRRALVLGAVAGALVFVLAAVALLLVFARR